MVAKLETAFFNKMVNDQGGIAGRKINFISYDDGYSPPKTVEQVRRLIEEDQVAFLFNTLGTPTNSAIERYVNQKKVPMLFISTGADKWGDYPHFPWTMGYQPSYRTEAQIYAKYVLDNVKDPKIAILTRMTTSGRTIRRASRTCWATNSTRWWSRRAYETTDATLDSPINTLQASGANVLLVVAIPKFAAMAIRKVYDLGWKPTFFMSNVSISVGAVLTPAGPEKAVGMLSTGLSEGSGGSKLGQRSGHAGVARFHGQEHAGRRRDRC